jgi:hypothetical protein
MQTSHLKKLFSILMATSLLAITAQAIDIDLGLEANEDSALAQRVKTGLILRLESQHEIHLMFGDLSSQVRIVGGTRLAFGEAPCQVRVVAVSKLTGRSAYAIDLSIIKNGGRQDLIYRGPNWNLSLEAVLDQAVADIDSYAFSAEGYLNMFDVLTRGPNP